MTRKKTQPTRHYSCTIVRTFTRTHMTLSPDTGELTPGHSEVVTEPCNVPLFGDFALTGVCRSCQKGWEVEDNRFASPEEKQRAAQVGATATV